MAPKRTPVKKLFADKESENVQENSPATNQAAAPISKMHQIKAHRPTVKVNQSNKII